MRDYVLLYINGRRVEVRGGACFQMLGDFLRYEERLTGTKIVCAEGDCGACTVLRAFPHPDSKNLSSFQSMNACIMPVALADSSHIITVEGLKSAGKLHPVQEAMVNCQGAQCGFCTPGFVMALTGMFEQKTAVTEKLAKNHLTGNLCRCTGYSPILEAACAIDPQQVVRMEKRYGAKAITQDLAKHFKQPIRIAAEGKVFVSPVKIAEAAKLRSRLKQAKIYSAATDLGVAINKGKIRTETLLSLQQIPELYALKRKGKEIFVGAKVTLTELENFCAEHVPELEKFLRVFASPQIKNVATLAGNVANGSPIGDTLPFLLISDAVVETRSSRGKRAIPFRSFYLGYRKTALRSDEFITGIRFRAPEKQELLKLYKVAQRKDLDISCVNAGFRLTLAKGRIASAQIAFGGVAATPLSLKETEKFLTGKEWNPATVSAALDKIAHEIKPLSDLRGSADYRLKLSQNLFRKFALETGMGAK